MKQALLRNDELTGKVMDIISYADPDLINEKARYRKSCYKSFFKYSGHSNEEQTSHVSKLAGFIFDYVQEHKDVNQINITDFISIFKDKYPEDSIPGLQWLKKSL